MTTYAKLALTHSIRGPGAREVLYLDAERDGVSIERDGDTVRCDFGGGRVVELPWAGVRSAELPVALPLGAPEPAKRQPRPQKPAQKHVGGDHG